MKIYINHNDVIDTQFILIHSYKRQSITWKNLQGVKKLFNFYKKLFRFKRGACYHCSRPHITLVHIYENTFYPAVKAQFVYFTYIVHLYEHEHFCHHYQLLWVVTLMITRQLPQELVIILFIVQN